MTDGVAQVSLAITRPLDEWLLAALSGLLDRPAVRSVVLDATGAAPDGFQLSPEGLRELTVFELPLVFAFEGPLKGGAAEVALAADIRVCSEDASLQGRFSGNARVRTLADDSTALALFLGGAAVEAQELLRTGLVSAVTAPGKALEEARRVAGVIASRGPIAVRFAREAIWRGLPQPLDQALRFETDLTLLLQTTKDRAEGVRAFLEKRAPNFTGE